MADGNDDIAGFENYILDGERVMTKPSDWNAILDLCANKEDRLPAIYIFNYEDGTTLSKSGTQSITICRMPLAKIRGRFSTRRDIGIASYMHIVPEFRPDHMAFQMFTDI